jgi:large subunit ribosomal protein L17
MRHGKKINHLGRTDSHRRAMLANMASSLIKNKRITTTLAKAKALRTYVEPLITKSKNDTTHSRRTVFSYLKDKETITILFREIAEKVATRPGGYTRILKLENRFGDNAEMAMIELVDYNEIYTSGAGVAEKKSTRRRGSKGKKSTPQAAIAGEAETPKTEETETVAEALPAETEPAVEEEVSKNEPVESQAEEAEAEEQQPEAIAPENAAEEPAGGEEEKETKE